MAIMASTAISTQGQAPAASADESQPDAIRAYLAPLVSNQTLAGAVTLVATRDRILYLKAVGFRDIAAKAPMASNDLFWIASTSKPMTATAMMMLVDEGKVNLDDPVEKYLPEFKGQMVRAKRTDGNDASAAQGPPALMPANHPIRVREILSHTSGLPFKSKAQPGALDLLPLKDAVKSFAGEPLLFQPGTDYSYSNEGLNTAARIIEVVTGIPYEQFMKDTTFWPNAEQISRLAQSYKFDDKTKELVEVPIDQLTYPLNDKARRYPMPAGGIFSTAEDVSKFCQMILNGGTSHGKRYISENSLHEMTSKQTGLEGKDYGFGWSVSKDGFGHGGAFSNQMNIDTADGLIVIFMVQQNGTYGTDEGKSIGSTLARLAKELDSPKVADPKAAQAYGQN